MPHRAGDFYLQLPSTFLAQVRFQAGVQDARERRHILHGRRAKWVIELRSTPFNKRGNLELSSVSNSSYCFDTVMLHETSVKLS